LTAKETIERALTEPLVDGRGKPFTLKPAPGLTDAEIDAAARGAGLPSVPAELRELLKFTAGLPDLEVGFLGFGFGLDEAFPCGFTIRTDGYGNDWVLDADPRTGELGPVFFACHDPAVIVLQSASLAEFLEEVLNLYRPGGKSRLEQRDSLVDEVLDRNPGLQSVTELRDSPDAEIRAFAAELDDRFLVVDLRDGAVGSGFEWGKFGADTIIRRRGSQLIFAIAAPERKSFWARLFGRG
jgi:hypothetical protein